MEKKRKAKRQLKGSDPVAAAVGADDGRDGHGDGGEAGPSGRSVDDFDAVEASAYIDSIIDMVPPKLYFGDDDGDESQLNAYQRFSKKKTESQAQKLARRQAAKDVKRKKLNPELAKTTLTILHDKLVQSRRAQTPGDQAEPDEHKQQESLPLQVPVANGNPPLTKKQKKAAAAEAKARAAAEAQRAREDNATRLTDEQKEKFLQQVRVVFEMDREKAQRLARQAQEQEELGQAAQMDAAEKDDPLHDDSGVQTTGKPLANGKVGGNKKQRREERLAQKRQERKQKRKPAAGADDNAPAENGTHPLTESNPNQPKKRRLANAADASTARSNGAVGAKPTVVEEPTPKSAGATPRVAARQQVVKRKGQSQDSEHIQFSRIHLPGERKSLLKGAVLKTKKAKPSKQKLLAQAEELQAVMKNDADEAGAQHAWSAAIDRAAGHKVLDDPKLLKRSVKKEQKQKDKARKSWAERQNLVKQAMSEKQAKRKQHINSRVEAKKESRMKKREKKLVNPGRQSAKASVA
eukprot:jgi/Chlat1/185/Chrsp1S03252